MLHLFRRLRARATRKPVRHDTRTFLTIERLEERCMPYLQASFAIPAPEGYRVFDNASSVTITVQLSETIISRALSNQQTACINYYTSYGSATPGTDYTETNGRLTWAAGNTAPQSFQVAIVPHTGGPRSFNVWLQTPVLPPGCTPLPVGG